MFDALLYCRQELWSGVVVALNATSDLAALLQLQRWQRTAAVVIANAYKRYRIRKRHTEFVHLIVRVSSVLCAEHSGICKHCCVLRTVVQRQHAVISGQICACYCSCGVIEFLNVVCHVAQVITGRIGLVVPPCINIAESLVPPLLVIGSTLEA